MAASTTARRLRVDRSSNTGGSRRPPASAVWVCPSASDMVGDNYWSYAMNMGLSVWEPNQNNGQPDKITGVGNTTVMVLLADAPGDCCSIRSQA